METKILQCAKCGARNRIHPHSDSLTPICGRCGTPLMEATTGLGHSQARRGALSQALMLIPLLVLIAGATYGIVVTPSLLRRDFTSLVAEEARKTEDVAKLHERQIASRQAELEAELAAVDASALRRSAAEHYKRELAGRRSYDKRFALSSREKAQLQMRVLATDSTRSFHDAICAVAKEASPKGADIAVRESSSGIALHIDFDMSSLTSGEHGTRTKHHTKESLKKEVVSLISRVTNDIFQFCRDLDLASIHVGCRHYVRTTYDYGNTRDENTMLYKIRIQKNRIPQLSTNPFLDIYSTTKYLEVDEDHFDEIEIISTRI